MGSQTPRSALKIVRAISPADYAGTAPTAGTQSVNIDTLGFRWATFTIIAGAMTATNVIGKITQSSDNFVSDAAADVTGATFTALTTSTDDAIRTLTVDLSKCERYLRIEFGTFTATVSNLSAACVLSQSHDSGYIGTNGVDANNVGVYPA
jgi:hypothetical protein